MKLKTFFIGILGILAVYAAGAWGFSTILHFDAQKVNGLWWSGIINTVNIVVAFLIIKFTIHKEARQFMKMFFSGMGIRVLLLLAALLIILKKGEVNQFTFILSFFILYVLFQMWEIWMINSYLRKE